MAVDLSIQLFAYELFNRLWEDFGGNVCRAVPPNTIPESLNVESHITSEIVDAVSCRQLIFQEQYTAQFEKTGISSCNSPSDFLANLSFAFSDESFVELKIFDRLLATCAFTMEMSIHCYVQGNKLFLEDDYLCLAMFFDTVLKSAFYERGGWKVLKSVAKSYVLPLFALQTLNSTPFFMHRNIGKYVTAVNDFLYFQTFEDQENQTRAKSWVNFRLRNAKDPKSNNILSDSKGLEDFLKSFKFLCDPLGERILEGDVPSQNENICSKFKGNEYLEKLSRKLSNCHLNYPTKQKNGFQDGLLVSPTPEVFQDQTDPDKAIIMTMEALGIEHLCNDKSIDRDLTTQKATFYNTLLNDSQVSKTNEDVSKIGISEEEYKKLWHQVLETKNFDSTATDLDRRLQEQDLLNNIVLHDVPFDQDLTLNTQNIENNLLKDDKSVHQNLKENNGWYSERLPMHDSMKLSMKVDSNHAELSHASVFMEDRDTIHTENEFASNETCQAKEDLNACVLNEMSQPIKAASLEGQEIQNVGKNKKKKKRKTKCGKSASNLSKETDTDDIKDILRMVLVLGCQPGLNYIRSTLKQDCKTTSV